MMIFCMVGGRFDELVEAIFKKGAGIRSCGAMVMQLPGQFLVSMQRLLVVVFGIWTIDHIDDFEIINAVNEAKGIVAIGALSQASPDMRTIMIPRDLQLKRDKDMYLDSLALNAKLRTAAFILLP